VNIHNLQPFSLWIKETPKSHCSPHDIVTEGCFVCFLHLCLVLLSLKHHTLQMHCSFKSTTVKLHMKMYWLEKKCWGLWLKNSLDWLGRLVIQWHLVAESCPTSHSQFQQWVGELSGTSSYDIFTKLREGLIYFSGNFTIHCSIIRQVAWSRQYSDLPLGYVWFEFWLWCDCLEWGFSCISSVSPGKHARVIPWLLSVQCFNSLALELVI
jgi:hypothetical protein